MGVPRRLRRSARILRQRKWPLFDTLSNVANCAAPTPERDWRPPAATLAAEVATVAPQLVACAASSRVFRLPEAVSRRAREPDRATFEESDGMAPTREIYWNITGGALIYLFALVAVGFLIYGVHRRLRLWRLGGAEARFDRLPERSRGC